MHLMAIFYFMENQVKNCQQMIGAIYVIAFAIAIFVLIFVVLKKKVQQAIHSVI